MKETLGRDAGAGDATPRAIYEDEDTSRRGDRVTRKWRKRHCHVRDWPRVETSRLSDDKRFSTAYKPGNYKPSYGLSSPMSTFFPA